MHEDIPPTLQIMHAPAANTGYKVQWNHDDIEVRYQFRSFLSEIVAWGVVA
jgi:hypothetical protein